MSESLHDFVVASLQATKGRWPEVATGSGVSIRTLSKVARRETRSPTIGTVEKLAKYFREQHVALMADRLDNGTALRLVRKGDETN